MTEEEKDERSKEVERKMNQMAASDVPLSVMKATLEQDDIYVLDTPVIESEVSPFSQAADISMSNVTISYDAQTQRWTVTGGGSWNNNNWVNDLPSFFGEWVGTVKNVGSYDTVGFTFYNTSGTAPVMLRSSAYITDHSGRTLESTSPSHGDGKKGVAFDYQDNAKLIAVNPSTFTYLGRGFAASATYSSTFTNYHGYARSFYGHTWNTTGISSVSFGGTGSTYGVTINFSSTSNRFPAYSNADKTF
ncbi:hypothetical protein [Paenibacillus vortex]|uniref:hypothetical protein n=1 Tax=Paenibacillus vortex TaxID=71995 RepID=UPI00110FCACC|nr:hypothetical protein [Paenibacillus vortex]